MKMTFGITFLNEINELLNIDLEWKSLNEPIRLVGKEKEE